MNTPPNEGMKPCPFCGGEAKFKSSIFKGEDKKSLGNVHCLKCYVSTGGDLQIYEQAIKAWNHRPDDSRVGLDENEIESTLLSTKQQWTTFDIPKLRLETFQARTIVARFQPRKVVDYVALRKFINGCCGDCDSTTGKNCQNCYQKGVDNRIEEMKDHEHEWLTEPRKVSKEWIDKKMGEFDKAFPRPLGDGTYSKNQIKSFIRQTLEEVR